MKLMFLGFFVLKLRFCLIELFLTFIYQTIIHLQQLIKNDTIEKVNLWENDYENTGNRSNKPC